MNTTLMKKLMAIGLSVCMLVTFMPILPGGNAFAASEADTIAYDADNDGDTDVTYYNVTSSAVVDNYLDNPKEYIKGLLSEKYIGGSGYEWGSTYTTWETISFYLSRYYGWLPTDHEDMTNSLKAVTRKATNKQGKHTGSQTNGSDTWYVTNTGLKNSESVSDAHEDMANKIFEEYQDAGGSDDKRGDVVKNISSLKDNDTKQITWYSLISANKTSGSNKKGHYKAYGVIFHDFKLNPILREDDSYYTVTTTNPSDENGTEYQAGTTKNETNQIVTMEQSWTDTQSYSETSEISGSKSYGFGETLTVGAEKSFGGSFKVNMEVSVSASQNIEKGWKEGSGTEETKSVNNKVSVEVPPYTNVMLLQSKESVTQKYVYDCPVALTYSVTIVEFYRNPNSNDEAPKSKILGSFLGNATEDLNQRAFVERTLDDKQGIEWDLFFSEDVIDHSHIQNAIAQNAKRAPMSMAGGTYTVTYRTTTSQVRDVMPILPLDKIKVANQVTEYTLDAGESVNLSSIDLQGYNSKNAAYYGFSKDYGQWQLLDIGGNVVTASDVADLTKDNVTGKATLKGKGAGTVYAKYIIDESKYATANQPNTYTKNSELSETAIIKFNIKAASPSQPDQPVEPDKPVEPDQPVEPDKPVEPDQPVEPDKPATCQHQYNEVVTAPTCEKGGYTTYTCGKCKESYVGNHKEATGHTPSIVKGKAATQSATGLTEGQTCSTCKKELVKQEKIAKISNVKLSYTKKVYTGSTIKAPTLTVKDSNGKSLKKNTDYTVSGLVGKKAVGRYAVKITFKGNYSGSKTLYFTIVPKKVSSATAKLNSASSTSGYDDIKFTWKKSTGATGYNVYYKKSSASKYTLLKSTTGTSVTKKNLSDGVKYTFKVIPYYKKSGSDTKYYDSAQYKTASVTTLKKVAGVKVSKNGTKVKVKWTNINGETGYQISKSTKKSKTGTITTYKTTTGTYKNLKATKGKTYYYKVRAYKVVDGKKVYGPWSAVKSFKRK